MRVIQIMDDFIAGGGVNSFVYDLCSALNERGCEVLLIGLLCRGFQDNPAVAALRRDGVHVECLGAESKGEAAAHGFGPLRGLIAEFSRGEKTVCNLHLKLSVLLGTAAAVGLKNVRCVETYHNSYRRYHLQCWALHPFIKKYICVSETARKEMRDRFFLPDRDLTAIPNGVSVKKIREMAEIGDKQAHSGITRVVSVGRLSFEKNFSVPVQALSEICDARVTYTLVGGGPQEEELRRIAGGNPNVKLLGARSRKDALKALADADVVVMPSLWEGRSILQLEAMALDKPMIISDVPGLREPLGAPPLEENEHLRVCLWGILVRTEDKNAYQQAVLLFSGMDRAQIARMKDAVREKARAVDIENTAQKYLDVFTALF